MCVCVGGGGTAPGESLVMLVLRQLALETATKENAGHWANVMRIMRLCYLDGTEIVIKTMHRKRG